MKTLLPLSWITLAIVFVVPLPSEAQTGLVVDSSGNVGIGTDTPGDPLEVNGETTIITGTTSTNIRQQVLEFSGGAHQIIWKSGGNAYDLRIKIGEPSVQRVIFKGNGDIGITAETLDIDADAVTLTTTPPIDTSATPLCWSASTKEIVLCESP